MDYKELANRLSKLREDDGVAEGAIKIGQGVEHQVFHKDGDARVTKLTKPNEYGLNIVGKETATPRSYLERLALQNEAFGDDIRWEGVTGDNRTITSQPFYKSAMDNAGRVHAATPKDIVACMEIEGFCSTGHGKWYNPRNKIIAGDAFPRNFIRDVNGNIYPIDLQLRIADAEEEHRYTRKEGKLMQMNLPPVFGPTRELAEARKRNSELPPMLQEDTDKMFKASAAWRTSQSETQKPRR